MFIPSLLRDLAGGETKVEVPGASVRQVINNLDAKVPGMKARLVDEENDQMNIRIAVSVDGQIARLGLLARVGEQSEVHFVPALAGG